MKHRLFPLVLFTIISLSVYSEDVDAIYVSSSNPQFCSVCYLLNKRPVITYKTDMVVVSIDNDVVLVVPFAEDERIKVEYGKYQSASINAVRENEKESKKCKKYLIDNKPVILRNGILYNINGTLYVR